MSEKCTQVLTSEGGVCSLHGGAWTPEGCVTRSVLESVAEHRAWQFAKHGANRAVPDGTGPGVQWLEPVADWVNRFPGTNPGAVRIEALFRYEWDYLNDGTDEQKAEARDSASWMRMVREEVAEAFKEDEPGPLYKEIEQFVALGVSWLEKIREREVWQYGASSWDGESVYADADWHSAADVMAAQHGMGGNGPVRVWRRHVGGEWERVPS